MKVSNYRDLQILKDNVGMLIIEVDKIIDEAKKRDSGYYHKLETIRYWLRELQTIFTIEKAVIALKEDEKNEALSRELEDALGFITNKNE